MMNSWCYIQIGKTINISLKWEITFPLLLAMPLNILQNMLHAHMITNKTFWMVARKKLSENYYTSTREHYNQNQKFWKQVSGFAPEDRKWEEKQTFRTQQS